MKMLLTLLMAALAATSLHAAPKKLLVVTTTTGFRHSSIPTAEKILAQLARDSGEFTVDFVEQPPGHPAVGFPPKSSPEASEADQAAFAAAEAAWNDKLKAVLQKLSPESLAHYDGVIFASTTGDLPIPDPQGFLNWIKAGHAFIGIHAASDTFHHWPDFAAMLGGEFQHHGPQVRKIPPRRNWARLGPSNRRRYTSSNIIPRRTFTTCSSSTNIQKVVCPDTFRSLGARLTAKAGSFILPSVTAKTSGTPIPI